LRSRWTEGKTRREADDQREVGYMQREEVFRYEKGAKKGDNRILRRE
jgi:hypothetical protein